MIWPFTKKRRKEENKPDKGTNGSRDTASHHDTRRIEKESMERRIQYEESERERQQEYEKLKENTKKCKKKKGLSR